MVAYQEQGKPVRFAAHSSKDVQYKSQPTNDSICYNLPLHFHDEDHFRHPATLKLASGTPTGCILNQNIKHNEVYQKNSKETATKTKHTVSKNLRFKPASDLRIGTLVIISSFRIFHGNYNPTDKNIETIRSLKFPEENK